MTMKCGSEVKRRLRVPRNSAAAPSANMCLRRALCRKGVGVCERGLRLRLRVLCMHNPSTAKRRAVHLRHAFRCRCPRPLLLPGPGRHHVVEIGNHAPHARLGGCDCAGRGRGVGLCDVHGEAGGEVGVVGVVGVEGGGGGGGGAGWWVRGGVWGVGSGGC